jgi:hypothetical protein
MQMREVIAIALAGAAAAVLTEWILRKQGVRR